jgi:hypothetical protein
MNAKPVFAAIAIAFAATGAMAIEATPYEPMVSTATRADVKAELAVARTDGTLMNRGEATEFAETRLPTAVRSRSEVRAEARIAGRKHVFDAMYVGSL